MTSSDLTDIEGVGPSRAETLQDAGFDDPEGVASASVDELDGVLGAAANPEEIIDNAAEVAGGNNEDRSDTRELELPDRDSALYLIKGLVDEKVRLERRNEYEKSDEVSDLVVRLFDDVGPDGGTITVDIDDLSVLYTSVRNIEQEFQGTRGVTDRVGMLRDLRITIQDYRDELWPDT